jgi:hypothetical protein
MSELKNTPEICKPGKTGIDVWLIGSAVTSGKRTSDVVTLHARLKVGNVVIRSSIRLNDTENGLREARDNAEGALIKQFTEYIKQAMDTEVNDIKKQLNEHTTRQ